MSDFLSKFNKENYAKTLQEDNNKQPKPIAEKPKETVEKQTENETKNKVETQNSDELVVFLDVEKIEKQSSEQPQPKLQPQPQPTKQEPTRTQEQPQQAISRLPQTSRNNVQVEELKEIDANYSKKQRQKFILIGLAVLLSLATVAGGVFLFNRVTVPNFIEKNMSEAKTWALKNRIELDITESFSVDHPAQIIFEQGKEANKGILKGSVLALTVSKGADPDEKIALPDFTKMKTAAIESWKDKNVATNIKIVKEFSETEENGKFLRMEFKDKSLTNADYRRKDTLTIYVSKGKEVFEKNIVVPDFKNKMKMEVEEWAKTNEVTIHFEERASDEIMVDGVISQSIAADEKVAKKDEITITISLGKFVRVPWFGNATMTYAPSYDMNFQVDVRTEYRTDYGYGEFIWQSVSAGTYLSEKDNRNITVYYSLGRPYIDDLEGKAESELPAYFYDFRDKGATITYTVHYVSGAHDDRGKVRNASKRLEYVDLNTHIDIYVYH